jgi:Uncharacterized protein conserved in bacteria
MKQHLVLITFAATVAAALSSTAYADSLDLPNAKLKVDPFMPLKAQAFPLEQVRLLDGPFKHAMDLDQAYLLALDPERLLRTFKINAGLPTTAAPLGGWEAPGGELRGHFIGHYISGCAMMYASTGDPQVKARGDAVVKGLAECQAKLGSGYLSAYPETFFDRVERRQQVWAPYYTMHKILAGLEDMYVYGDNQQALEVAKKYGDWFIARNARLTDEQMQNMLGEEHGGMNEALANLYALTGEDKYLKIALRFNHYDVIGPAMVKQDPMANRQLHANTQIPKFIGTAREYEMTGDYAFKTASLTFWNVVVSNRSYVIGGNSDGEQFSPPNRMSQMGPKTTETCNTYNMLKLTRHLFCWNPQVAYADYYERALYNHILASQNPDTGMMCYYVPLRSGSEKTYNSPNNDFWCCTGTGVENHAKYGDSIYFRSGKETLYVNLFIASELNWKDAGIKVRQETRYPDESSTKLIFTCDQPVKLKVNLRHPYWAVAGYEVRVNGEKQNLASAPGSWAVLDREWKSGDLIEISMPFSLHTEAFKDKPDRFAFMNGPLVLAAPVDTRKAFPVVVADEKAVLASLKPAANSPNTFTGSADVFRIPGVTGSGPEFKPFYKMFGQKYEVYWDRFTTEQWQSAEASYRDEIARQKAIEARTVDAVICGEEQDERDHALKGEGMSVRTINEIAIRSAATNGWFSWDFKVVSGQPLQLSVTYSGVAGGGRGPAPTAFDILVDGTKLASEQMPSRISGQAGGAAPAPTIKVYPLDPALLQGKSKITVKLQGQPGSRIAGVRSVRVMKPE